MKKYSTKYVFFTVFLFCIRRETVEHARAAGRFQVVLAAAARRVRREP